MAARPAHDSGDVHRTCLSRDFSSAPEQRQGRNTADVVSHAEFLGLLGIELRQPELRFELSRGLYERWRHHPAGAAPRRPEIDEHRYVVAGNIFLEIRSAEFHGVRVKQRLLAFAAGRLRCQFVGRHAVYGIAMRADDMR